MKIKMKDSDQKNKTPLVYSCSGCSSAAQMANHIAVKLDRNSHAEMSCIAGVGGGVKSLVKTAQSNRPIIAIEGCPLKCVYHCLQQHQITPTKSYLLSEYHIPKLQHQDFDLQKADEIMTMIIEDIPNIKVDIKS